MKKKIFILILTILFLFSNLIINVSANLNSFEQKSISKKFNKQIYLGTASIVGNGNSSELSAELENDILIKLNSTSSLVDFYINYDMKCNGLTDEGVITLTILLNDENVSFNFVQTPTSKNGTLKIENVEIQNRDALTFRINVAYGSVIPLHSDSISATGFGIVNKNIYHFNNILKYIFINYYK